VEGDEPVSAARRLDICEPRHQGKYPFWPDALLQKIIRPAASRPGINKKIGWHTFRHTFSTILIANCENVKVVQELMRHARTRCTLEVYSQARIVAKRQAQQRVVQMILPEQTDVREPLLACGSQIDAR
jgi:site-specific recombinase XerD